eukprot:CAMPEP_0206402464 /NCGR_PEP_ID=MMETSP0294-20121207/26996_1 /ASSEMBLY_ACC=CAM_ASM_000327 /TAXON_ID=39354 /ORGANISM="Heterosigma akashiwo, Strain CCMP2393" /LENGTH=158 /DNA_ID=CAMNT_0053859591 /DNA_START=59 /DNA_END=532 /DNA_ORIENTATION=+
MWGNLNLAKLVDSAMETASSLKESIESQMDEAVGAVTPATAGPEGNPDELKDQSVPADPAVSSSLSLEDQTPAPSEPEEDATVSLSEEAPPGSQEADSTKGAGWGFQEEEDDIVLSPSAEEGKQAAAGTPFPSQTADDPGGAPPAVAAGRAVDAAPRP